MSGILNQTGSKKVDISLRQLVDLMEGGLSIDRPDIIENNFVLSAYNVEGRNKGFYFRNLSDLIKAGSNVSITEADGVLTINATASSGSAAWGSIGSGSGVASQSDLITYLNANYYPLSSNPASYLTSTALLPYLTIATAASTYVPLSRNITINGTTQDLSVDRTWTVASTNVDLSVLAVTTANQREDDWAPTGWPGTTDIVKVIDITPTHSQNILLVSGLASPSAGRIVTLRNRSTNHLIIFEHKGASTAGNQLYFHGQGAFFLLPERSVTLLYNGTYWEQLTSNSNYGGFDQFDDFSNITPNYASTSTNMYYFLLSGSGSGIRSESSLGLYGAAGVATGTTNTGNVRGTVDFRRGSTYFGNTTAGRPAVLLNKLACTILPDAANDFYAHLGFNGSTPTALMAAAGYGFVWEIPRFASGATNFRTVSSNTAATIVTTTVSGLALRTSNVWLGIFLNGNHGEATYFYSINGNSYVVDNKFTRTTGNYSGSPFIGIAKTVGTTAREIVVDFSGLSFNTLAR